MKIYLLIILFFPSFLFAQILGEDYIDDSIIQPWLVDDVSEYQYSYQYGISESKSFLSVICDKGKCFAQISSGYFNEEATDWINTYENLEEVRIVGNKFFSAKTTGEFVLLIEDGDTLKALKIDESWTGLTDDFEYEIGVLSNPVSEDFQGKYPQASLRFLNKKELLGLTKKSLKIMRFEIYARYGYVFENQELSTLFSGKDWYVPQHREISQFLTSLEKENLALINRIEKVK